MRKIAKLGLIVLACVLVNSCGQQEEKINGITLTEARQKTMELLKTDNPEDVSYITEEYLKEDFKEIDLSKIEGVVDEDGVAKRILYGHDMSYGWRNGQYVYLFKSDQRATYAGSCSRSYNWWATFNAYDHYATRKQCNSRPSSRVLKFVER